MNYHLTIKSGNAKTGPIPVSTSAGRRGRDFPTFLRSLADTLAKLPARQLWRHNQAGDLPGKGNRTNRKQCIALAKVSASAGSRGYTYTHKPCLDGESPAAPRNRETIAAMNRAGMTVNLSGNNPAHADRLADLAIAPVVAVLPSTHEGKTFATPAGRKGIVCPAQLPGSAVTCATCGLCAVADPRRPIVGFLAHGPAVRRANLTANL